MDNNVLSEMENDGIFKLLISGMDAEKQAQLNLLYARRRILDEYNHQQEMAELEQRITNSIMKNVSIRIETEAIKQLRDMLNGLGK